MAGEPKGTALLFQAALLMMGLAGLARAEEPPARFGDPEVVWEEDVTATPTPPPTPEAPAGAVPEPEGPNPADVPAADRVQTIIASVKPGDEYPAEFEALLKLGDEAVPALGQVLADSSAAWQSRWIAAMALGRIGGSDGRAALEAAAADPLFLIRMAGVTALGNLADASSAPVVRKALEDRALVVRSAAVESLAKMKDREAVPLLEEELWAGRNFHRGKGLWIRERIVAALEGMEDPRTVPVFLRLLKDTEPAMRQRACEALGKVAPEDAPPVEPVEGCAEKWQAWAKSLSAKGPPQPP